MRPIDERVILVTGATDGLGKLVARRLAKRGAAVLLHGRDREKGEAALAEIRRATGNGRLAYHDADLSSLAEVRRLAEAVGSGRDRLDVLINNAGIGARSPGAPRETSADGYELRFAVNYLAPFLLSHELVPLLRRSAPARIVNVASVGQQRIDFDDPLLEEDYDDLRAYRQSKLADVMLTFDLAEELEGAGVTANSLHPGSLMDTKMVLGSEYFGRAMSSVEDGADAVARLAVAPELEGVSGEYFDGTRRARADEQAYDPEARRRLRELAERLTGVESLVPAE